MILAKEVLSEDGQVLCGPGIKLTSEVISRLERSGVESIAVKGHPVEIPGEKPLKERLRELEDRFSRVMDDPVQRALMKLIAEYWVRCYKE
ncbi:hypothetical protein DBT_0257 [Dissulfuribacter thermophilus]|uniref:Uncharacterized protein n=1 Tax=Dissulfuribacter thermophilus TaxID=1156395 RepID=A0A1B9F954_9BACT|nr:hypothetical protein [Dissulfuribacter thermophilus]OCC16440.1 hypothetical protein DBT_0257 [Dissulfuribacter thermophilus]